MSLPQQSLYSSRSLLKSLGTTAFLLALTACENDMREVAELTKKPEVYATETIKQMDIVYSDSAQVKVHLTAPLMKHFTLNVKEPYEEFPQGTHIEFFNDKKEVKSTLSANYAIRYDNSQRMEAKYKVVVVNEKGEQLFTEHLIWDEAARKITTNGFVTIVTKKDTLRGEGMRANEDFSSWELSNITGTSGLDGQSPN